MSCTTPCTQPCKDGTSQTELVADACPAQQKNNSVTIVENNQEDNQPMSFMQEADKINKKQCESFIKKILQHFGNTISQKHIGIWGLSCEPDTDNIHGAASITIIKELLDAGACITVYDPAALENIKSIYHRKIRYAQTSDDILHICDFLIILTQWEEFLLYEPKQFLPLKDKLIFDVCGCFDSDKMINAGLKYFVPGRNILIKKTLPQKNNAPHKKEELQLTDQSKIDHQHMEKLLLENIMAHVFEDSINSIAWIKSKSFSPRGGAANYSLLYIMFRVLNDIQPRSIIEFGIGQSSKLTSQYVTYGTEIDTHLTLVENDPTWINIFKKQIPECDRINILNLDIEEIEINRGTQIFETTGYKDLDKNIGDKKFDFIIVDGPRGCPHFSRIEILDLLEKNLANSFIIIMDDYNRIGEQETAKKVMEKLDSLSIKYESTKYKGITTQLVIYSPCYFFLKSL